MAWSPLTTANVTAGNFLTTTIMTKIKDCLEYLYNVVGSQGDKLINGSFELDADADGEPDSWEINYYPGGSGSLLTSVSAHGAQMWRFVHPGGASNGGGYMDSDYIEVTASTYYWISFSHYVTAAGMHDAVYARCYDKDKSYISSSSVYDSVANPTSFQTFTRNFLTTATTKYVKIRLIGGQSDVDVAGTAYFDGVQFGRCLEPNMFIPYTTGSLTYVEEWNQKEYTTSSTSVDTISAFAIPRDGSLRVQFARSIDATANGSAVFNISYNGTNVATFVSGAATGWSTGYATVVATQGATIVITAYTGNSSATARVKDIKIFSNQAYTICAKY